MNIEQISGEAFIFRSLTRRQQLDLFEDINDVASESPFRHMSTPRGHKMSVAMTNCGALGWITDRHGYRYVDIDPMTGKRWPPMPNRFHQLAEDLAGRAGFPTFTPDACLINRYETGVKLSLHQDRDEQSYDYPIVSVSLGRSARFTFGGMKRTDAKDKYELHSGDVVVWGGDDRLRYHSIDRLIGDPVHHTFGPYRYNLTLRKAS